MTEKSFTVPRGEHADAELANRLEQFASGSVDYHGV